jgi:hypothetical protein
VSALFDLVACDSKSEMEERLRTSSCALLVGVDAQSPRSFYTLKMTSGNPLVIGLSLSGLGPKPSIAASRNGARLLIGHDRSVTLVDVPSGKITATHSLEGGLFQFVEPVEESVVVIHELGALKVGFDGSISWTVPSSDVVESFRVEGGRVLELSIAGFNASLRISLANGRELLRQ